MGKKRDTYRYTLWDRGKKVYIGITDDLARREQEHRAERWRFTTMHREGPVVTRETALEWEQNALEAYRRGHGGRNPRYNKQ